MYVRMCMYVSGIICNMLQVELPSADLDCSLSQYVDIICSEFYCCYQTISHLVTNGMFYSVLVRNLLVGQNINCVNKNSYTVKNIYYVNGELL